MKTNATIELSVVDLPYAVSFKSMLASWSYPPSGGGLEKSLPIAMQTSELVNSGSLITNPVFVLCYHSIFMVKNDIKVGKCD